MNKLQNGDFVWIWDSDIQRIEWGFVFDNKIINQMGGFYDLDDFDEDFVVKPFADNITCIGGVVRNANSFVAAQSYYEYYAYNRKRFIDHNTNMKIMPLTDDNFVIEADKEFYREMMETPMQMRVSELEHIFGGAVCIVSD